MRNIEATSSGAGWAALTRRAILETLGCVAGAIAITFLFFQLFGAPAMRIGIFSAAVVAGIIAAAFSILVTLKRQEIARLRQKLNQVNSIDSLTLCLDGSVFSALVDSYQTRAGPAGQGRRGGFLIIDVDHFKSINERFGHAWGDEALRVISAAIKACLRSGDLVGRLGGEEFGVFLPGATESNAAHVAERMRSVISETLFEPGGKQCDLSVTVGAVVFESQLAFDDLFRAADSVLATAKREGRNQARIEHLPKAGRSAGSPYPVAYS